MFKGIYRLTSELENLYIGWVYNPIIDQWNKFADFHNQRVDQSRALKEGRAVHLYRDEDGMFAVVRGKTTRIREHWYETDMLDVLSQASGQPVSKLKQGRKINKAKKRPSKRL